MYEDKAVIVMCYAYHMGLNTINHQWVMPGWYSDNWWDKANNVSWEDYKYNCTSEQIQSMVNHSLLLDAYLVTENLDEIGISGRVSTHVCVFLYLYGLLSSLGLL